MAMCSSAWRGCVSRYCVRLVKLGVYVLEEFFVYRKV